MSLRNGSISMFPMIAIFILGILFIGCSQETGVAPSDTGYLTVTDQFYKPVDSIAKSVAGFSIEAREASIRSCSASGGIFVIRLVPEEGFSGDVRLSLKANNRLNAELDRTILNLDERIAEITINPSSSIAITTYTIEVKASYTGNTVVLPLEVEIIDWPGWDPEVADQELAPFIPWLETEFPELGDFSERIWSTYLTYPGILVVEHWTYLDADWELRLCYHVMIPPYDWSRVLLRRRGEWDPILAAERDTYGDIYEIPIEEY